MTAVKRVIINGILPAMIIAMAYSPTKSLAQNDHFHAAKDQICIQNKAPYPLLLTAESNNGKRQIRMAGKMEILCVGAAKNAKGVVAVFENINALEGCSRLANAGKTQTLIKYASFDNCQWAD